MDYKKIYNHLCKRGKTERKQKDNWGRWERHHIIPRHAGGSNVARNMTRLQHKEHALAHHLLYRIYHRVEDKLAYKMLYGQGHVFHSVAEAAHFYNLKPYTVDNWVRRGSKGWSRIANTDMA